MGYRQIWKCDRCGHEQDYQWSHYDRATSQRVGRDMCELIVSVTTEQYTRSSGNRRDTHKVMWCSECTNERGITRSDLPRATTIAKSPPTLEEMLEAIVDRRLDERGAGS